jgi:hypothetical protein
VSPEPRTRSSAYRDGWHDGRYESSSDRLDHYRGYRAGRETRLRDNHLLEAS